jgi:type I restriction enzyme S subunit
MGIAIAVPASDEQRIIADFMDAETAELQKVINSYRAEITLLQEYRTRLIADVVTGKLDVRTAAAALSETADAQEVMDEIEESLGGEELLADSGEADLEEAAA